MSGYGKLLRLSLLNHWAGFRRGSWRKADGKIDISRIATMVILIAAFGVMAWVVLSLEIELSKLLTQFGQPLLLPAMALFVAMVSTLILGLFPTLSTLYFNRDAAWMAALPVSSIAVMGVKLTEIYVGDLLINLGLVGPAAVLYGLNTHANVLYYVRFVAIILASPLLPLAVTALLVSLLTRVTGLARHKEAVMILGSLVLVAVIWGIEFTLLPRMEDEGPLYIVQLLLSKNGLVNLLLSSIPPVQWAVQGLQGDWLRLAMFLLVSLLAITACLLLVGRGYLSACLSQTEHAARHRAARIKGDSWQTRSPLKAIFLREWNELVKTPSYAFNAFSGVIIFPVMILAMYLAGLSSAETPLQDLLGELNGLLDGLAGSDLMLIFAACLAFPCFMNITVSTAVTREGGRLFISRMLPVSARTMLHAKLLTGLVVSLLSMVSAVVIVAVILPGFAMWLIPAALLALMVAYATAAVSLTVDAIHPRLNWVNETQAMKQNLNALFAMLLSMVMMGLVIALPLLLPVRSPLARLLTVIAALAAECVLASLLLRFVAEKRYAELEG